MRRMRNGGGGAGILAQRDDFYMFVRVASLPFLPLVGSISQFLRRENIQLWPISSLRRLPYRVKRPFPNRMRSLATYFSKPEIQLSSTRLFIPSLWPPSSVLSYLFCRLFFLFFLLLCIPESFSNESFVGGLWSVEYSVCHLQVCYPILSYPILSYSTALHSQFHNSLTLLLDANFFPDMQ